jgi:hypothetical protein
VIERIDAHLRPLAVAFRTLLDEMIVHIGKNRVVHLKQQTGLVNLRYSCRNASATAKT